MTFFDNRIAQEMKAINPRSEGTVFELIINLFVSIYFTALAILRNNFTKLCHCLPDDYQQTIDRIRQTKSIPQGLLYQLALQPTAELANCHILGAMIRPLREEISLVRFCDSVKRLMDSTEAKEFVENLKTGTVFY